MLPLLKGNVKAKVVFKGCRINDAEIASEYYGALFLCAC